MKMTIEDAVATPPAAGKRARTRQAILTAALRLFSEKGIGATTVLDVTEALGISNGAFYYHFQSMDRLLEIAGHEVVASLVQQIAAVSRDDPAAQVARGPLMILRYVDRNPALRPIILRVIEDPDRAHVDLSDKMRADLLRGISSGRFALTHVNMAVRFARGLIATAVRMREEGDQSEDLVGLTAIHFLQLLGIGASEARALVAVEEMALD